MEIEIDMIKDINLLRFRNHIKDWFLLYYLIYRGLSHATLEEVFMRVTGKKVQKN